LPLNSVSNISILPFVVDMTNAGFVSGFNAVKLIVQVINPSALVDEV